MEIAQQSSGGIRLLRALALEPGCANGDRKAGEVGLRGEEVKDLKEDERCYRLFPYDADRQLDTQPRL